VLSLKCLSSCRSCWHHRPPKWGNIGSGHFAVSTLTFYSFVTFLFWKNILQLIYTSFLITTCLNVALCWNIVIPHTSMYHSKWFKICAALFQFVTQPGTCFCICYSEHNEYAHSYDVVTAHAAELLSELLEHRQLWYHVCIHLFQTFLLCRCSTWTVHIW